MKKLTLQKIAKQISGFINPHPDYYLYDSFTDGGSLSDNGVIRDLSDPNSSLTFDNGLIVIDDSSSTSWDCGITYQELPINPGLCLKFSYTRTAGILQVGFIDESLTDLGYITIRTTLKVKGTSDFDIYSTISNGNVVVIHRENGEFVFLKIGSNWTLLYCNIVGLDSDDNIPIIYSYSADMSIDYIKIPKTLWLPSPILSDGFSSLSASDGLGHPENTELGSGGDSLTYTNVLKSWALVSGKIHTTTVGLGIRTCDVSETDLFISCGITYATSSIGIIVRYVDTNNYIVLRMTSTAIELVKVISGSETVVGSSSRTYVAGKEMSLFVHGNIFRVYYNNQRLGSDYGITDDILQTGTIIGLYTNHLSNYFDNLIVYAIQDSTYNTALEGI